MKSTDTDPPELSNHTHTREIQVNRQKESDEQMDMYTRGYSY